jgi:hypothetical protein
VALVRTDVSEERDAAFLLVITNVATNSPSLSALRMEVTRSLGTSVVTRPTRRHISEYGILCNINVVKDIYLKIQIF